MNKVILLGRLTKKPSIDKLKDGTQVSKFSIAVDRAFKNAAGEKETDFFNVVAWRSQAEYSATYLDKGYKVLIEGHITTGTYQAQDGSTRNTFDIVVESITNLEPKKETNNNLEVRENNVDTMKEVSPKKTVGFEVNPDDLPF